MNKQSLQKHLPLYLALLSIAIFTAIWIKNELHIKQSHSIFVELQPVDPRSLMQGDYMVLNYALYFDDSEYDSASVAELLAQKGHVLSYIDVDKNNILVKSTLIKPTHSAQSQHLWLKNPHRSLSALYPSSRSFFFAEGLAECYQQAKYAEFKVNAAGQAILVALRGERLKDLGCEQQQSWLAGQ